MSRVMVSESLSSSKFGYPIRETSSSCRKNFALVTLRLFNLDPGRFHELCTSPSGARDVRYQHFVSI
jgi:hypothetical protein